MIRQNNSLFRLLLIALLSMVNAIDHVRKLSKWKLKARPLFEPWSFLTYRHLPPSLILSLVEHPSGGGGGDDLYDDDDISGGDESGGAEDSSAGGSASSYAVLPSPATATVTFTYVSSNRLAIVGAIGGLAFIAGVWVLLAALAKRRRRRSPKIDMGDDDVLVNRTTAKATSVYQLEPLQDKLPMPVPKEITARTLLDNASSSFLQHPTTAKQSSSRSLKGILVNNNPRIGRQISKPSDGWYQQRLQQYREQHSVGIQPIRTCRPSCTHVDNANLESSYHRPASL
jgi:hypothetical protein